MGAGRLVIILDDDTDLRETMGELLHANERQCISVGSFSDLTAFDDKIGDSDLAILDINLGPSVPSGVDAYRWLREHGFKGRIVFLTGHAQTHPQVEKAYRLGDARVLEKPILAEQLIELIRPAGPPAAEAAAPPVR
jgi:FixJ family two-component response regulator